MVLKQLLVINKLQAGKGGTEHELREPGGLPLSVIIFCQSEFPAAMSAGSRTFTHFPPCTPHATATQLLGFAPDARVFHRGLSDGL